MAQILVVDDEVGIRELLSEILADEGHTVQLAENATQAREIRSRGRPDLVLLDIWMPDADGITLLKEWAASGQLSMPVVMMSGHATIDTAVEATRIGALDFLEKPIALQKLLATVKRALAQHDTRGAKSASIASIGKSPALVDLRRRLLQAIPGRSSVLLRGELGAMPEMYARLLHQAGTPWVNASPLLGQTSLDLQQQAAGGVLFVDDLARLSANQQKHLAFVAGNADKAKMRLVSFSSEGPRRLTEARGFDPALVSRLSELVFAIPAVREHLEDVPEIAKMLLGQLVDARFCPPRRFGAEALAALMAFDWPGNLDDMVAVVRTLAIGASAEEIGRYIEAVLPRGASSGAGAGSAAARGAGGF
jgi:DNA-binding NtrC family response regulator